MKLPRLAVVAIMSLCIPMANAASVNLQVGGTLNNPAAFNPGAQLSMGFTLASDTQVTALGFEFISHAFGFNPSAPFSTSLTGAGGAVSWAPGTILSAGSYLYSVTVLACPQCFPTDAFLATNFYQPAAYTQNGGSLIFQQGTAPGVGFDLVGDTVTSDVSAVPEPASAVLVGSGLLAAFAGMRRRFGSA
jgi:hypothetical protein